MKKLFKLFSGLIAVALVVGVGVSLKSIKSNEVKEVNATVTNGQKRFNILVESSDWRTDGVYTNVQWNGDGYHRMLKDSDLPSSDLSEYNKVKLGGSGTEYYFETIEVSSYSGFTYDNYQFGRGSGQWNSFWAGSPGSINTDNTLKLTGTWDHFGVSNWGTYYKVNRHTGTDCSISSIILENAYNFTPSDPAAISGYTFNGWYTDSSFTNKYTPTTITGDLNLYAKYTKNPVSHTVTYASNGATSGSVPTQADVFEGSTFTVASYGNLVKTNYEFTGWSDGSSIYQPGDTYRMGTSNVTLTAQWGSVPKGTVYFTNNKNWSTVKVHSYGVAGSSNVDMTPAYVNKENQQVYKAEIAIHNNYQFDNGTDYTVDITSFTENTGFWVQDTKTGQNWNVGSWNVVPFTIAFNANGGSGSMSNVQAYNDAYNGWKLPANTFTRTNYEFVGWATTSGGSVTYTDEGNIPNDTVTTAGQTYTLYAKWESTIHTYEVKVNNGGTVTTYPLELNEGDEWKTTSAVSLLSGNIIEYWKDGAKVSATAKSINNNNCWNNSGNVSACLNVTSKIYIDIVRNTIFCDGLGINKLYLVVDDTPTEMTYNQTPIDPSFTEYYKINASFAQNSIIKFANTRSDSQVGNVQVFSILTINSSSESGFEVVDGKLKCTKSGGATVNTYAKLKSGADEVYFGNIAEDLAAAIKFAQKFNSDLAAICNGQGHTVISTLRTTWSTSSGEFSALITAAQTILTGASHSHDQPDIANFAVKYDYIYGKYASQLSSSGGDFASRNPVQSSSSNNLKLFDSLGESKTTISLIVVISLVAITSIASFFFFRKRKEN